MKKTISVATVLAAATLLGAGLILFPGSVQEAQANPCSIEGGSNIDAEYNCDFEGIGSLIIIESGGLTEAPFVLPTP